ncbi:MAG: acyltransferase [Pseudomonadales bacterium]
MSIHPDASVHASAIVDDGASIGARSRIWHFVHICSGARIGELFARPERLRDSDVTIGNNVRIRNNVIVFLTPYAWKTINVFCGPSMVFTNVYNPRSAISRKDEYRETFVRRGATLGANCTIVCGNEIGEYAFVSAGAVVNKPVPSFALMVGMPAMCARAGCADAACSSRAWVSVTCALTATYHINDRACTPR